MASTKFESEEYKYLVLKQEVISRHGKHASEIIFELTNKVANMERVIDDERRNVRAAEVREREADQRLFDANMEIRDLKNKLMRAERGHPTRYRR